MPFNLRDFGAYNADDAYQLKLGLQRQGIPVEIGNTAAGTGFQFLVQSRHFHRALSVRKDLNIMPLSRKAGNVSFIGRFLKIFKINRQK